MHNMIQQHFIIYCYLVNKTLVWEEVVILYVQVKSLMSHHQFQTLIACLMESNINIDDYYE